MSLETEKQLISVSYSISKLQGLYRKIAIKRDIPLIHVQIFYILYFNEHVTQKQIHQLSETPKQTINSAIKELKSAGFIVLASDDADKRQKFIQLTPAGTEYCRHVLQPFFSINERAAQRAGTDLTRELADKLHTFCRALELEIQISDLTQEWEETNG